MTQKNTRRGFTLIELLVVVLIIGILAAVAVPQYRLAVEKSRFMELMTLGDVIYKAQKTYYLANGTYTTRLADLDVSIDTTKFELHMHNDNYSGKVLTIARRISNAPMMYVIYYSPFTRDCRARESAGMIYKQTCYNLTGKQPKSIGDGWYSASF